MTSPETLPRLTRQNLAAATAALRRKDPRLGVWMDRVGPVGLRRQAHQFGALCRSVISQQLAAGAAATIHRRFVAAFAPARLPSPERLLELTTADLRACGLSLRKLEYLRGLAREFHQGDLRRARLGTLSNDEVVERLTRLDGIGRWTAEMFLIFSLGRPDVFAVGDLALRKGVERVVGRPLEPRQIEAQARLWSPYRSVASFYLWRIAHWP